jgi:Arc/MetJ-type ribon-helix-helix transcriptional regulator
MPKEEQDFRGVSLKRELVNQVEQLVKDNQEYKSVADFVHEAVRLRMQEIKKNKQQPRFEHFNINDDGARISDRKLGMIADIYFKPQGIFCDLDKSNTCEHIDFALTIPKIQEIIRKKLKEGWKLPDV